MRNSCLGDSYGLFLVVVSVSQHSPARCDPRLRFAASLVNRHAPFGMAILQLGRPGHAHWSCALCSLLHAPCGRGQRPSLQHARHAAAEAAAAARPCGLVVQVWLAVSLVGCCTVAVRHSGCHHPCSVACAHMQASAKLLAAKMPGATLAHQQSTVHWIAATGFFSPRCTAAVGPVTAGRGACLLHWQASSVLHSQLLQQGLQPRLMCSCFVYCPVILHATFSVVLAVEQPDEETRVFYGLRATQSAWCVHCRPSWALL